MNEHDKQELEKLRQELADECRVPASEVTVITCGATHCDHDSKGPWVEEGNFAPVLIPKED